MPPRIVKPFAQALNLAYERAMRAREAVEHRLVSIPQQELIVRQWRDNLPRMAAELYPRHDVLSYPVQTRMQRDFEKFERYQSELQERLEHYATALQTIEQTSNNILVATNRDSSSEPTVLWPACPSMLCDDPWPHHWPPGQTNLVVKRRARQNIFSTPTDHCRRDGCHRQRHFQ